MDRIKKLQQNLPKNLDYFLISDNNSLFYLLGLKDLSGYLLISKNSVVFFNKTKFFKFSSKIKILDFTKTIFLNFFNESSKKTIKIGFDGNFLSYSEYVLLKKEILKNSKKIFLKNLENPLIKLRQIKSKDEIFLLKKAAKINYAGFLYIKSLLKEGVTEKKLALEYEIFIRKKGALKLSFAPIIAFSENAYYPHHIPTDRKLKKNDFILMDLGCEYENYQSDMTRTISFNKKSEKFEKILKIVKKAKDLALKKVKSGVKISDVKREVVKFFEEKKVLKNFTHQLGHGIGIEVHEKPSFREDFILEENMVITIEPGIYKKNWGGIRLEDTILVTKNGFINLY